MELISKIIPVDCNLFQYSCTHSGNALRSKDTWTKFLNTINSEYDGIKPENNYAVDHGDPIEGIYINDKKYDGLTTSASILEQIEDAISDRKDIADRIICMLDSNHAEMLWRYLGKSSDVVTKYICEKLKIKYGTWTARITYRDKNNKILFKQHCTHGRRAINSTADDPVRRKSNIQLILKRHLKDKSGDCLLMTKAHVHKLILLEPSYSLYITGDDKKLKNRYRQQNANELWIHPDHRWYVSPGSFLKLYAIGVSGYAEKAEYDPTELGFSIVKVRSGTIAGVDMVVDNV